MRQDIHRPSAINPVEYTPVGNFYQGDSEEMQSEYRQDHAELEALLGEDWWRKTAPGGNFATKGSCDHCGTHFAHGLVFRHEPTGELIAIGHQCAASVMLPGVDRAARQRALKERAAAAAKTAAAKAVKREAFLDAHPGLAEALQHDHYIVADIASKFRRYADLSEKQVALVFKIVREDAERAAQRSAEAANSTPVVEGKAVVVEGLVKATKWKEDLRYGDTLKMLVLDDRGFKVWGTVPAALRSRAEWDDEGQYHHHPGVTSGDRVRFTASVEASADDPTFGFFKRPRKAEILQRKES